MKLEKISYSESRESVSPHGLKSWRKYGVEIALEDGDDKDAVSLEAKRMIEQWYQQTNAGLPPSFPFQNPETLPVINIREQGY